MRRALLIRDILLLTIGVLTLLVVTVIARSELTEWHKLVRIQSLDEATDLGNRLFDVTEKLAVERDVGLSLAHGAGNGRDLLPRFAASRQDTDSGFIAAAENLKRYGFDELAGPLKELADRHASLQKLCGEIETADPARTPAERQALAERWFADSTGLILQTQKIWMMFIQHFSDIDPVMIFHLRFKHLLGIIMDYSDRQRAVIGRLLADNTDPSPEDEALLLEWHGATEIAWDLADTLAQQGRLFPSIAPSFEDARSHYFNDYNMVRNLFYRPGHSHGTSYPITVEFWFDMANGTTDSLNVLRNAALDTTRRYIDILENQARISMACNSLFLLFALILCFYSFYIVLFRVIRPVNAMVEALVDATQGKPVNITPQTFSRRDEIGKLAYVLHMFQQNADEVKRTSEALGESQGQLRQSQKMEAIGTLTGGMAHDFNNLLGVIIGNLDTLGERLMPQPELKQLAQAALDAALRGADLTRRLLAFARRQPLQPQRIDVNNLIEGITKLLTRMIGEQVQITLKLAPGLRPVTADPAQLEAAITNLATNARDAMPLGGRLIITTANGHLDEDYTQQHPEAAPGDYTVIEVSDTGSGMAPDTVARIFEPFFTTKEPGKGTGLGLSMVFGFIKQSGGHINVYSEVGTGTVFRLYLPPSNGKAAISAPANSGRAVQGHETVLVVEDNEAMRIVVKRQLGELGYNVLESVNADQALERLAAGEKIDLVFTDVVMPGKTNGMELARIAIKRWPALKIVLTSGYPDTGLNGGPNAPPDGLRLLSKPYLKQDLAKLLREVLEGKTTTAQ